MFFKKGFISLFIIIGLLIILSTSLFLLYKGKSEAPLSISNNLDTQPIKSYVELCIEKVAVPGIYLLAKNGGYIFSHDSILLAENEQIAYHYDYKKNIYIPDEESMNDELNRFISMSLLSCVMNMNMVQ